MICLAGSLYFEILYFCFPNINYFKTCWNFGLLNFIVFNRKYAAIFLVPENIKLNGTRNKWQLIKAETVFVALGHMQNVWQYFSTVTGGGSDLLN